MARLIILHVAEDAAMARQLCTDLPEFRSVPLPAPRVSEPFKVGAGVVLVLLWSPRVAAAGAAMSFLGLAAINQRNAVIVRLENAALAPSLARLQLPVAEGYQSSQEISALLRAAAERGLAAADEPVEQQDEVTEELRPAVWARREVAARARSEETVQRRPTGFAGGMARGFASSVAVLGISGGVTLGVSDQLLEEGFFVLDANATPHAARAGATDAPAVAQLTAEDLFEPFRDGDATLGTFDQTRAEADALRRLADVQRAAIEHQLAAVTASLDASRKLTDGRIQLLERAAGGAAITPMQMAAATPKADEAAQIMQAAAPQTLQQAAAPQTVQEAVLVLDQPIDEAGFQQAELLLTDVVPAEAGAPAVVQTVAFAAPAEADTQLMSEEAKAPEKLHDAAALILAKTIAARQGRARAV